MDNLDAKPLALPLTVYERPRGWISLNLRELAHYRELLYFLTWRVMKVHYAHPRPHCYFGDTALTLIALQRS